MFTIPQELVIQDGIDQMDGQDDRDEAEHVGESILETVHEVEAAMFDHVADNLSHALVRRVSDFRVIRNEFASQHVAENLISYN